MNVLFDYTVLWIMFVCDEINWWWWWWSGNWDWRRWRHEPAAVNNQPHMVPSGTYRIYVDWNCGLIDLRFDLKWFVIWQFNSVCVKLCDLTFTYCWCWQLRSADTVADTVCIRCDNGTHGSHCQECKNGFFRLAGQPLTKPCQMWVSFHSYMFINFISPKMAAKLAIQVQ